MKRLFCFLCLLLLSCILFPVFLVSASALVEVDGNNVNLAWWYDNPADYVIFENQVISRIGYDSLTIQVDVELNEIIKAKSLFSFEMALDLLDVGSISVIKFQPLNVNSVALDDLPVSILNNKITVSDLQYKEDIKYFRIQFLIEYPHWIVEADESYITIAGTNYNFQKGTTWGDWVNSEYNVLGLFLDNGGVYGDNVKLTKNGTLVKSTDYIIEQASYSLEALEVVPTTISFTVAYNIDGSPITTYQADYGMTWAEWVVSDYNTGSFTYTSNQVHDKWNRTLFYENPVTSSSFSYVSANDVIEHGYQYSCVSFSTSYSSRGYNTYTFDFSVSSVSTTIEDEKGLLNGIFAWVKNIDNNLSNLPSKIIDGIENKFRELFIPNDERILAIKDNFELELRGSFGALFDAVDIVDMVADSFVYSKTETSIKFPSITVNLVGVPFTFGGYEVDVVPDGFEGIVDILKLVVNMVSTVLFVMAMKKRLEEVLS